MQEPLESSSDVLIGIPEGTDPSALDDVVLDDQQEEPTLLTDPTEETPAEEPAEEPTEEVEPSEEPKAEEFKEIVVDGFGVAEDIHITSADQLRDIVEDHRNKTRWRQSLQSQAEELKSVAEQIRPYYNLGQAYQQLDPRTQAVFRDVLVERMPLETALQRANIQYNENQQLPDPTEDLDGYINARIAQATRQMQPPPPQQPKVEVPPQLMEAQKAILSANGTALETVRAQWHQKFAVEQKIPGFDFSSDEAPSWKYVAPKIRDILAERKLDPQTQVIPEAVWNEILEKAVPKLAIAQKKATAAAGHRKQTAQVQGKQPSAGAKKSVTLGGNGRNWFD